MPLKIEDPDEKEQFFNDFKSRIMEQDVRNLMLLRDDGRM